MPSSYTTSLRLTLPATGELAGQWGSTVNTGITELLDAAVAGTTVISTWGGAGVPYTLSNNSGTADEARKMFIVATGTPGEAKNVICPAVSKLYVFRNDTTGGFALTLKTPSGTGVSVPAGQYKMLYCDGTNVVEAVNSPGPVASLSASQAVFTDGSKNLVSNAVTGSGNVVMSASPTLTGTVAGASLQLSSLTSGRVTYAGASGLLQDSTNLTFDGTSLTLGGNPTLSAGTANGVLYLNGSKVATSGSALTFDGGNLGVGTSVPIVTFDARVASDTHIGFFASGVDEAFLLAFDDVGVRTPNLNYAAASHKFLIAGDEQMRLTSTGLGIGTSSPAAKLQVQDSGGGVLFRAQRTGTDVFDIYQGSGITYLDASASGGQLAFSTVGTEGMRLNSTGLGIGTSSPRGLFDLNTGRSVKVYWGSAGTLGETQATAGDYVANNLFVSAESGSTLTYTKTTSDNGNAVIQDFSRGITFYTGVTGAAATTGTLNNFERMRLDSSGNLGLGVTPSAWGTAASRKAIQLGYTGGAAVFTNATGNTLSSFVHNAYDNGTNWLYAASSVGAARYEMTGANAGSTHAWYVSAGGTAGNAISFTQAMTLDADGNLSVGTTSVFNSTGGRGNLSLNGSSSAMYNLGVNNASAGYVYHSGTDMWINNVLNGIMSFYTNNTERARITSGGDLLVGTTAQPSGASSRQVVKYDTSDYVSYFWNANASPYGVRVQHDTDVNGTGNGFLICVGNATERASIRSNGGIANYSANNVNLSDRREKTNFAPAKPYLDTICAIPVQTFEYIDQSEDDPGLTLGVVAQDVQAVAPELVMESNWGTAEDPKMRLSIYQTDLQYALMKCIQELKAQNDELRARVAALESN